jgi:hypothetical protein
LFPLFATGVIDIGGKFAASVVDTGGQLPLVLLILHGGKFAAGAGIVDTGGKFSTGINNSSKTGGKIFRRCR